jgi:hypothetical protein
MSNVSHQREYLGDKMNELAMNTKNKNIRDLYILTNELRVVTGIEVT